MAAEIKFDADRHEYSRAGVIIPSVTQIIRPFLHDFSHVDPETLRLKQEWGTKFHLYSAAYDRGELDMDRVDDYMLTQLGFWQDFKDEKKLDEFDERLIEHIIEIPYDRWIGTLDRAYKMPGRCVIVDIKTAPINPATGVQLAGYAKGLIDSGFFPFAPEMWECSITEQGMKKKLYNYLTELNNFLSCLTIYNWRLKHGFKAN